MRNEGQPRGVIQKVFSFMRGREMQRRQEPASTPPTLPTPQPQRTPRWDESPLLSEHDKAMMREKSRRWNEQADRAIAAYNAESRRRNPPPPEYIYVAEAGKMMNGLEHWLWFQEQQQKKREMVIALVTPKQLPPEKINTPAKRGPIAMGMYETLRRERESLQLTKAAMLLCWDTYCYYLFFASCWYHRPDYLFSKV